jgi:adenine-specific DNA methylase
MSRAPSAQPGQMSLDLFASTTLTPADVAPVALVRIPMRDPPTGPSDGTSYPPPPIPCQARPSRLSAVPFRLTGDRGLAQGWKRRALDNIEAIRIAKTSEAEQRAATAEEQASLIKFCAFSSTELAQSVFRLTGTAFRAGWETIGATLEDLVSPVELAGLSRATQYAHYTPEYLVRALWTAVTGFGFAGGRVLEPGCGTGLFITLEPEALRGQCHYAGIEGDPITAKIACLLYPDSAIRAEDFTKAKLTGRFDLVIGNPPFSDRTVRVPESNGRLSFSLHDAFIARSLANLRPGGIGAFVVSRWTMDKADQTARAYVREWADLVGAIRLPAGAMRAEAGTDVVVDLLFFRARDPGAEPSGPDFLETAEVLPETEDGEPSIAINRYFLDHPATVLGRHQRTSSPFGPTYTCAREIGPALEAALGERIAHLPKGIHTSVPLADDSSLSAESAASEMGTVADGATIREGSYVVIRGHLRQIVSGVPVAIRIKRGKGEEIPRRHAEVIQALIPVRDAVRDVLRAQEADQPWQEAQSRLCRAYASFVRSYGPINRTKVVTITDRDTGESHEIVRRLNLGRN